MIVCGLFACLAANTNRAFQQKQCLCSFCLWFYPSELFIQGHRKWTNFTNPSNDYSVWLMDPTQPFTGCLVGWTQTIGVTDTGWWTWLHIKALKARIANSNCPWFQGLWQLSYLLLCTHRAQHYPARLVQWVSCHMLYSRAWSCQCIDPFWCLFA